MLETEALHRAIHATLLPGFVGLTLPDWLVQRLRSGLGGVCLFGANIESPTQLRELTDSIYAANRDAIIAIDEEGGDVTRLYYAAGSPYPGNAILGRIDDLALTEKIGRDIGWELRRAGCNLNFAPDADINSNPDNPVIGVRSFGSSAELVARHSAAFTAGLQATGVAACAKHFPGHGATAQDSHLALPVIDVSAETLGKRELEPFRAVIASGAKTIMTSHILVSSIDRDNPATFSRAILGTLLRDALGFEGLIVSDALDMKGASGSDGIPAAAVRALAAGCNLLCIGTDNSDAQLAEIVTVIEAAITAGRLDEASIAGSAAAVVALARTLGAERAVVTAPSSVATAATADPTVDLNRLIGSFDVRALARDVLAASAGRIQLVRIDTVANIAVGEAPWGPFAEFEANPDSAAARELTERGTLVITEDSGVCFAASPDTTLVIVGKDNHRHGFARSAIDAIRDHYNSVVVVDMGWPSDGREYADVATFGASRLVGRALAAMLTGTRS